MAWAVAGVAIDKEPGSRKVRVGLSMMNLNFNAATVYLYLSNLPAALTQGREFFRVTRIGLIYGCAAVVGQTFKYRLNRYYDGTTYIQQAFPRYTVVEATSDSVNEECDFVLDLRSKGVAPSADILAICEFANYGAADDFYLLLEGEAW